MGEITDALRRANENRAGGDPEKPDREPPVFASSRVRGRGERFTPLSASAQHCEITDDRSGNFAARAVAMDRRGPIAESCRHLALRVRTELDRRRLKSFAIVGPLRNEGKTTLACDLALALASVSKSREVALVDLDLRRPSVARSLTAEMTRGIDEHLKGEAALADVRVSIDRPALDIFPVRKPQQSAHELLVGPALARLVEELEQTYSTIVFDTPPALLVPDVSLILRHVGAYAVVARVGKTRKRAFRHMLGLLPKDRLIGGILNEGPLPTHANHYGYYADEDSQDVG
jgi:succinoglycan biosynthesis transport protein ExoP